MEANVIDIYLSDYHYIQRTPNSKILKINTNDQIVEKYENREDLPIEVKNELEEIAECIKYPEKYFNYYILDDNTLILTEFKNENNLVNVIIPEYIDGYEVTELDACLFNNSNIESLIMSDNITRLGGKLCCRCNHLHKAHLSRNIDRIPLYCFYRCKELTDVNIHDRITSIEESAFEDAKLSGDIIFSPNLNWIGVCAFANCNFENIKVFTNTFIEPSAFSYKQMLNLKTYYFPIPITERTRKDGNIL